MTDLSVLANDTGHFTIAALDHRDALLVEMERAGFGAAEPATLTEFKKEVLIAIGDRPSAVMLDPEYSLPELANTVAPGVGITCALESQGYLGDQGGTTLIPNTLLPDWAPAKVTEVGAHAAKLLVLYHHDRGEFTTAQEALVAQVVDGAAEAGVPALIEPVPTDITSPEERAAVIVAAAQRLAPMGPMLLKLPYPGKGWCEAVNEACGERPWALLSWGVGFDEYSEQLQEACAAGCSGFTAGRALWREALPPDGRAEFLSSVLLERFVELEQITESGPAWHTKI